MWKWTALSRPGGPGWVPGWGRRAQREEWEGVWDCETPATVAPRVLLNILLGLNPQRLEHAAVVERCSVSSVHAAVVLFVCGCVCACVCFF